MGMTLDLGAMISWLDGESDMNNQYAASDSSPRRSPSSQPVARCHNEEAKVSSPILRYWMPYVTADDNGYWSLAWGGLGGGGRGTGGSWAGEYYSTVMIHELGHG